MRPYLILAKIGAFFAAIWSLMRTGRALERGRQAEERQAAQERSRQVRNEVDQMSKSEARRELKRWSRDD